MKALIVVDMLRDFMEKTGALYCGDEARRIIPFVKKKIEECRASGCAVIYVCDAHDKDDKEFRRYRPHCVAGTEGAEVIEELKPLPGDTVFQKKRFSGFYGTGLEEKLKHINPESVEVVGVCTSICVMDTVGGLKNRDYEVKVYQEGVADFDSKAHRFALERMQKTYGAEIV